MSIKLSIEEVKPLLNKICLTILKYLKRRKYITSELSKLLNLSVPTVLYHLSILENAGYVRKVNSGRKWIYYESTELGHNVLKRRLLKLILLTLFLATITILTYVLLAILKKPTEHAKPM